MFGEIKAHNLNRTFINTISDNILYVISCLTFKLMVLFKILEPVYNNIELFLTGMTYEFPPVP